MKTSEGMVSIPAELKADLREALAHLDKRARDPEAAKKACERMDRLREENRKLFGEQEVAVEIIRGLRDSQ
jgi:hypothetical protein